jgi:enamine deaminase RidA (YjgF/YER057c/UK114 family)
MEGADVQEEIERTGLESDGATMPSDFAGQARLVWQHLCDYRACRTVAVQQLLEQEWLIEIEAIAARVDDPAAR